MSIKDKFENMAPERVVHCDETGRSVYPAEECPIANTDVCADIAISGIIMRCGLKKDDCGQNCRYEICLNNYIAESSIFSIEEKTKLCSVDGAIDEMTTFYKDVHADMDHAGSEANGYLSSEAVLSIKSCEACETGVEIDRKVKEFIKKYNEENGIVGINVMPNKQAFKEEDMERLMGESLDDFWAEAERKAQNGEIDDL